MNVNEFFKAGSNPKQAGDLCGRLEMSVQAHAGACSPRKDDAEKHLSRLVFRARKNILMKWCEEVHSPPETVYGYVPAQVVTNVLAKHGGIVEGNVPRGVAPIPAKFTADI